MKIRRAIADRLPAQHGANPESPFERAVGCFQTIEDAVGRADEQAIRETRAPRRRRAGADQPPEALGCGTDGPIDPSRCAGRARGDGRRRAEHRGCRPRSSHARAARRSRAARSSTPSVERNAARPAADAATIQPSCARSGAVRVPVGARQSTSAFSSASAWIASPEATKTRSPSTAIG